jgi:hypothetical protein
MQRAYVEQERRRIEMEAIISAEKAKERRDEEARDEIRLQERAQQTKSLFAMIDEKDNVQGFERLMIDFDIASKDLPRMTEEGGRSLVHTSAFFDAADIFYFLIVKCDGIVLQY